MYFPMAQAVDLNLIVPLFALLEERHVTRAAERCGTSQPAMSRMLDRLRVALDDELLVRSGGAYERTPRGDRLVADLRDLLPHLETTLHGGEFDPASSRETFVVTTTDYAAAVYVPFVLAHVAATAPHVRLEIAPWHERVDADLQAGRTQLAIIGNDALTTGFETEPLFADEFACVVAEDHPLRSARPTLDEYLAYEHVVLLLREGGQPWIEDVLAGLGRSRRVAFRTPFQLSAVAAAATSEMICTTARRLAAVTSATANVRVLGAPSEFPVIGYHMAWHRRLSGDAAHRWLRDQLRVVASSALEAAG